MKKKALKYRLIKIQPARIKLARKMWRLGGRKGSAPLSVNGFTLSEALMALLIGVLIAGICLGFAQILNHAYKIKPDDQEQFAILQIREMITTARKAKVEQGSLWLIESSREERLVKDKNRLVKQPGYEILMENLEDVYFEIRESRIWLSYKKGGKERSFQVG